MDHPKRQGLFAFVDAAYQNLGNQCQRPSKSAFGSLVLSRCAANNQMGPGDLPQVKLSITDVTLCAFLLSESHISSTVMHILHHPS